MEVGEISGERANAYGRKQRGIVVRRIEDSAQREGDRYFGAYPGPAGTEFVVTGREVRQSWESFARVKAEHDEQVRIATDEQTRRRKIAEGARIRLATLGYPDGNRYNSPVFITAQSDFKISPDVMVELLAKIPSKGVAEAADGS